MRHRLGDGVDRYHRDGQETTAPSPGESHTPSRHHTPPAGSTGERVGRHRTEEPSVPFREFLARLAGGPDRAGRHRSR
jgi:hypothetical protein